MASYPIQTVHGVSSPIVRGIDHDAASRADERSKSDHTVSTQLYREETAKRLEENNERARDLN
ncbi:hypothetical protein K227x_32980 [Rubripirellula lacrimiformis]|uniref:Uncharacterized protein n=1 Tax=Rubripirellula lacrimiformis TaxID=1930273 RepID=A0A517NCR9_9BACT|nr:hypothetical protein [Rubripirellula lacrimiformis]QDT04901.1 hypothetical protein K227x_32980 [Rubripirellula lacrimiformis]